MFWTRTTPFWGFHGSSDILQTLFVAPPSWFQDGGTGKWRPFRFQPPSWMTSFLGNQKLGHPRRRPEAEGPPFSTTTKRGSKSSPYTTDFLLKLGKDYFKSISSHIKYFKYGFMRCFLTNIQLLIHSSAYFWSYGIKMLHGIWYEIKGLNHEMSYWNLAQVISRVFQVI